MQNTGTPWARFAAFAASVALFVAACGGGGASPSAGGGGPSASAGGGSPSAAASPAAPSPASPAASAGASPAGSAATGGSMPPAPSFGQIGGSVSVLATWTGAEEEAFKAMVAPFTEQTGIKINYTGTRDLATQITTGIAGGNVPDVAGLPGPGQMVTWARQGALKPLDGVLDLDAYRSSAPAGFADLGVVDGKMVGIFTKATVKGLIWYNPNTYTGGVPADWNALMGADKGAAEALWCVGLESGGDSGWPGTDWIEDIVIRQSGPDVYDRWQRGELKWSSPEIKSAFEEFGRVLENSFGGSNFVVGTNFGAAGNPLFTNPPGCLFHHQASFITSFFQDQGGAKDGDFDFFVMPDINPQFSGAITGGGDLFGMFNDTPQARALIQWLTTPQAQEIWAKIGGGYLAANKFVDPSVYPDETSRKSAEIFINAQTFRFDAGDLMPTPMARAFFSAMVEFAQNPGNLDSILANLDSVQADAYSGS